MDAGSTGPLGTALAALVVFVTTTLSEGALLVREGPRWQPGVSSGLTLLKTAAVIALALSLTLLVAPRASWIGVALAALGLWLALALLGAWSKALGRRYPGRVAPLVTPLVRGLAWVTSFREHVTRTLQPEVYVGQEEGEEEEEPERAESRDERIVLPEERQLDMDEATREMVQAVLDLKDTWVREVMVPRVDIVAVEVSTPLRNVAQTMVESGHSRLPVYRDTIDTIIGVVHARDLLRYQGQNGQAPSLERLVRPVFFVPEFKTLDELLEEFKDHRLQVAIVVDEYGGVAGMVTMEDLLEEIVGEIEDEFSRAEPEVTMVEGGDAIVDARVTLDEVNELFDTRLEGNGFDTMGGYVYSLLGKMPKVGDVVTADGLRIAVLSVAGRRIRKLRVSRNDQAGASGPSQAAQ